MIGLTCSACGVAIGSKLPFCACDLDKARAALAAARERERVDPGPWTPALASEFFDAVSRAMCESSKDLWAWCFDHGDELGWRRGHDPAVGCTEDCPCDGDDWWYEPPPVEVLMRQALAALAAGGEEGR